MGQESVTDIIHIRHLLTPLLNNADAMSTKPRDSTAIFLPSPDFRIESRSTVRARFKESAYEQPLRGAWRPGCGRARTESDATSGRIGGDCAS